MNHFKQRRLAPYVHDNLAGSGQGFFKNPVPTFLPSARSSLSSPLTPTCPPLRSLTCGHFSLSVCAGAGLARLANAAEGQCLSELCYDATVNLNARTELTPTALNRNPRTNAARLALGLSPKPPSRRHRAGKCAVYCGPIHVRTHIVFSSRAIISDTEEHTNGCG